RRTYTVSLHDALPILGQNQGAEDEDARSAAVGCGGGDDRRSRECPDSGAAISDYAHRAGKGTVQLSAWLSDAVGPDPDQGDGKRSEEHTSELQSLRHL